MNTISIFEDDYNREELAQLLKDSFHRIDNESGRPVDSVVADIRNKCNER